MVGGGGKSNSTLGTTLTTSTGLNTNSEANNTHRGKQQVKQKIPTSATWIPQDSNPCPSKVQTTSTLQLNDNRDHQQPTNQPLPSPSSQPASQPTNQSTTGSSANKNPPITNQPISNPPRDQPTNQLRPRSQSTNPPIGPKATRATN